MTDIIDVHLEKILKAAGSSFRHYETSAKDKLRAAMAEILASQEEDIRIAQENCNAAIEDYNRELEDRKTVEDLCRSIRFCTIQECAELVRTWAEDHKTVQPSFTNMTAAILALQERRK